MPKQKLNLKQKLNTINKTEQSNASMTQNNSSFFQINKNLDNNEVYIPVVVSRENFIVQLKIVDEANKTLHHIKTNKIDQNKLEKDIKLT